MSKKTLSILVLSAVLSATLPHIPMVNAAPIPAYNRANTDPFDIYSFDNIQVMADQIRGEGHAIPTGHPRIFINGANNAALANKIQTHYLDWVQEAVDLVDANFGQPVTDTGSYGREPSSQPLILTNAIIYQLGEIQGINYYGRTPAEYGAEGVRQLMELMALSPAGGIYGEYHEYLAPPLGYDWLYDLLTQQQRDTVAQVLLDIATPPHSASGQVGGRFAVKSFLGPLAVLGDGYDDARAQSLLDNFFNGYVFGDTTTFKRNNLHAHLMTQPEGPGNEGFVYDRLYRPLVTFLEGWYDQTGQDYFKLPLFQLYPYHAAHVQGNQYEWYDNGYNTYMRTRRWTTDGIRPRQMMLHLSASLARTNPEAASLALHQPYLPYEPLTVRLFHMLRADPDNIQPQSPADLNLKTTAHYRGSNDVYGRDSWTGTDTTWFWFESPTWLGQRNGGPPNNFVIWKNGAKLLAKHGQQHDYDAGNRTNSLVLYDASRPNTTFIPRNATDNSATYLLIHFSHGQSLKDLDRDSAAYNPGLQYLEEKENEYLYVSGDGGHSFQAWADDNYQLNDQQQYITLDLPAWNRQMAWFRGDDIWIMLDRVQTPSTAVTAQVPFHFGPNPEIRSKTSNSDLGPGTLNSKSNRFEFTTIGGIIYYSRVADAPDITIELKDPGVPNSSLSVTANGHAVAVSLATNASGDITTTNLQIVNLINNDDATKDLINGKHRIWPEYTQVAAATGGPIALDPGNAGIWQYDKAGLGGTVPNRIVTTNTLDTDWGKAHARLFIDTLYPPEPIYYRMGGIETRNMDFAGYLNVDNLQTNVQKPETDPWNIALGLYKVQIASPVASTNQTFLNVLQATDSSVTSPADTTLLQGAGIIGAAAAGKMALFSASEATINVGSVTIPPGAVGTYDVLISDLEPNTLYDIELGSVTHNDIASSNQGVLYFQNVPFSNPVGARPKSLWNRIAEFFGLHHAFAAESNQIKVTKGNAVPDTTPPTISNVQTINVGSTSATVIWNTDEVATSRVDYGLTTQYGSFVNSPALVSNHVVVLTGLSPETQYHFKVSSSDASGNPAESTGHTFTTTDNSNSPPSVDAGIDQTVGSLTATLDGTVTDDGRPDPPGVFTTLWSKVSGPGTVTFGDENAIDTSATFSAEGVYVLELQADDSALQATDTITVTVSSSSSGGGGLLAWWKFDGDVQDSASSNHGTNNGGSFTNGQIGQAIDLQGTDHVMVDTDSGILTPREISISGWLNPAEFGNKYVVARGASSTFAYEIRTGLGGQLYFRLRNSDGVSSPLLAFGNYTLNQWTHITVTWDGATIKMYQDGAEVANQAFAGTALWDSKADLGLGSTIFGSENLQGLMDEFCIFGVALDAAAVSTLASGSPCIRTMKLEVDLDHWKEAGRKGAPLPASHGRVWLMDEGTQEILIDGENVGVSGEGFVDVTVPLSVDEGKPHTIGFKVTPGYYREVLKNQTNFLNGTRVTMPTLTRGDILGTGTPDTLAGLVRAVQTFLDPASYAALGRVFQKIDQSLNLALSDLVSFVRSFQDQRSDAPLT